MERSVSESARSATPGDLERIAVLWRDGAAELVAERGGVLWARRDARPEPVEASLAADITAAAAADPDRLVVVGCYHDAVVGFATVRHERLSDGSVLAVLGEIYVDPEARSVGVGEVMMDQVLAWCEASGCRGIDAVALPGMRATKNFFERFGLTARAIVVHRRLGPSA